MLFQRYRNFNHSKISDFQFGTNDSSSFFSISYASIYVALFSSGRSIHTDLDCTRSGQTSPTSAKMTSPDLTGNKAYVRTTRRAIFCSSFWKNTVNIVVNSHKNNRQSWLKTNEQTGKKGEVFSNVHLFIFWWDILLRLLNPAMLSWGRDRGNFAQLQMTHR